MFLINSILFFTIVSFVVALNADESDKAFIPCGLYGFRCLDKKRAQICDEKREDGECSPKPRIFECADGLICDEEKKEFCAPMETSYSNCTTGKSKEKMKRGIICKSQYDIFDDIMEPVTTATYTSTADYDDDDEKPIVKPEDDPWNGNPPITCGSHGFYPGLNKQFLNELVIKKFLHLQTPAIVRFSFSAISREADTDSSCDTCDADPIEFSKRTLKLAFSTEQREVSEMKTKGTNQKLSCHQNISTSIAQTKSQENILIKLTAIFIISACDQTFTRLSSI